MTDMMFFLEVINPYYIFKKEILKIKEK